MAIAVPMEIMAIDRTTSGEEVSNPRNVQIARVNPGFTAFMIWMKDTCNDILCIGGGWTTN